jgi:hypothetical protein
MGGHPSSDLLPQAAAVIHCSSFCFG